MSWSSSRGSALAKCSVAEEDAKTYNNQASAKRALAYYRYFREIFLYDERMRLIVQFVNAPEDILQKHRDWRPIEGCELRVIEL